MGTGQRGYEVKPGDKLGTATVASVTTAKMTAAKMPAPDAPIVLRRDRAGAVEPPSFDEPFVCVTVPIPTVNPLNRREHWAQRSQRAKRERDATAMALLGIPAATWVALAVGCEVTLTRVSKRPLSEDEGLRASLKHIRDVVAVELFGGRIGERDDDPRARWEYRQIANHAVELPGVIVSIRRTT